MSQEASQSISISGGQWPCVEENVALLVALSITGWGTALTGQSLNGLIHGQTAPGQTTPGSCWQGQMVAGAGTAGLIRDIEHLSEPSLKSVLSAGRQRREGLSKGSMGMVGIPSAASVLDNIMLSQDSLN